MTPAEAEGHLGVELVRQTVGVRLEERQLGGDRPYRLWEHRSWNRHRGVILYAPSTPVRSASELVGEVRHIVRTEYDLRWTWLRGFGFGVAAVLPNLPPDFAELEGAIDLRNRLKGVFQWLVVESQEPAAAFAVHTWTEGYLSPTYRLLVRALGCPSVARSKGALFQLTERLTGTVVRDFRNLPPP